MHIYTNDKMKTPLFEIYEEPVKCPNRALLTAILARAILDLSENIEKTTQDSAKRFIMSRKTSKHMYHMTFEDICGYLEISADDIRNAVFQPGFDAGRFNKFVTNGRK